VEAVEEPLEGRRCRADPGRAAAVLRDERRVAHEGAGPGCLLVRDQALREAVHRLQVDVLLGGLGRAAAAHRPVRQLAEVGQLAATVPGAPDDLGQRVDPVDRRVDGEVDQGELGLDQPGDRERGHEPVQGGEHVVAPGLEAIAPVVLEPVLLSGSCDTAHAPPQLLARLDEGEEQGPELDVEALACVEGVRAPGVVVALLLLQAGHPNVQAPPAPVAQAGRDHGDADRSRGRDDGGGDRCLHGGPRCPAPGRPFGRPEPPRGEVATREPVLERPARSEAAQGCSWRRLRALSRRRWTSWRRSASQEPPLLGLRWSL
jgi:hypothetical protein